MSGFLTLDEIRQATAGSWLVPPARGDARPLGVSIDSRDELGGRAFLAIRGERFDGNAFAAAAAVKGAALVIVERDVGPLAGAAVLAVADGRTALADLARAWRSALTRARVIAVTGSAGKTTTRRLIDGVLSTALKGSASPKSFNNEIGVPLTILSASRDDDYLVVEIGMNRPGEILALARIAQPAIAAITMVGRAHLEGLGSLEAIAREKSSLLEALPRDGVAVVNGTSAVLADAIRARRLPVQRMVRFGDDAAACDISLAGRRVDGGRQDIEVRQASRGVASFGLSMPGEHNAMNALVAIAVARELGLADDPIRRGLATVEPAAMRLERLAFGDVTVFNDAYNANPDAMAASIRAFAEVTPDARRRILVLGDMLELGPATASLHREVGGRIAETARAAPIGLVVAVGSNAGHTISGAVDAGWKGSAREFRELDAATTSAIARLLEPGDCVLLKGSRGAALERLIADVEREHARPCGAARSAGDSH